MEKVKTIFWYILLPLVLIVGLVYLVIGFGDKFSLFDDYSNNMSTVGSKISDNQAKVYADRLHVAMGSLGTDYPTIKLVLTNLSLPDFAKVSNFFGVRGYIDSLGVGTNIPSATAFNLVQWLESELSISEKRELKKLISWF